MHRRSPTTERCDELPHQIGQCCVGHTCQGGVLAGLASEMTTHCNHTAVHGDAIVDSSHESQQAASLEIHRMSEQPSINLHDARTARQADGVDRHR